MPKKSAATVAAPPTTKCAICGAEIAVAEYGQHVADFHASPVPKAHIPQTPFPGQQPGTVPPQAPQRPQNVPPHYVWDGKMWKAPAPSGRKTFSGNTEDASAPVLAQAFWKPGRSLTGTVIGFFDSTKGKCVTLKLPSPLQLQPEECSPAGVDVNTVSLISIGMTMRGLQMAMRSA